MNLDELCCRPITETAPLIEDGSVSPVELTIAMLARIERLDPSLHAYVRVNAGQAMRAAEAAQARILAGEYSTPLLGIPLGVKDIFDTASMATECGSAQLRGRLPGRNAEVVDRLEKAGAIIVGKQATAEFAFLGYPPAVAPAPVNPWSSDKSPGMSSGGSAVAVAASLCFGAFGSDTGGSIRVPSAVNGIVGLKPTFGRISRRGVHPFSTTLDHVGPLARSVADAALLYRAVAGHDPADPFSAQAAVGDPMAGLHDGVRGLRIGMDMKYLEAFAAPEVILTLLAAAGRLEEAGGEVVPVDLLEIADVADHWLSVVGAEAWLRHERDPARPDIQGFGKNYRELLGLGKRVSANDLLRAQAAQRRAATALHIAFQRADSLLLPGLGGRVPSLAQLAAEPDVPPESTGAYLAFTAPFDFSGHPTLSLPYGLDAEGLPYGLQLVARPFDEAGLFRVGRAVERQAPVLPRPGCENERDAPPSR